MGILADRGHAAWSDRAANIPSHAVREESRKYDGLAALSGDDASDYHYGHALADGRLILVRISRRPNVPPRENFRRVAVPPPRCLHVINGGYASSCAYCAWLTRPDRQPVKRDRYYPLAGDLDLVCGEIDPATEDEQTPLSIAA